MKQYGILLALLSKTVVVLSHEIVKPSNLRGEPDYYYTTTFADDDAVDPFIAVEAPNDEDQNDNNDGHHEVVRGGAVLLHEDLCQDIRRARIQTCTNNCVTRSTGSKTRYQCRVQCTAKYQNNGTGRESTGPGKYHTIAPTPTPPSRGRIACIQNCSARGGSVEVQRMCKAKCPVPEKFDWELC